MSAAIGRTFAGGIDAIGDVPPERWRIEDFYSEDRLARDRIYSRWGAFLDPLVFDPVKWHIPPASLPHIEPMQLLSLEVAWQAMVDAGYDPLHTKSGEPAALAAGFGPTRQLTLPVRRRDFRASGRACCSPCRLRTNWAWPTVSAR